MLPVILVVMKTDGQNGKGIQADEEEDYRWACQSFTQYDHPGMAS